MELHVSDIPAPGRPPLLDILGCNTRRLCDELTSVGEDASGTKPEKQLKLLSRYYPELSQVPDGQCRIIAHGSKKFTDTEQRYSTIEKEAKAIYNGILHFRPLLIRKPFIVYTDLLYVALRLRSTTPSRCVGVLNTILSSSQPFTTLNLLSRYRLGTLRVTIYYAN